MSSDRNTVLSPWGELADMLEKRSKVSKTVTITAGTASFIASHLRRRSPSLRPAMSAAEFAAIRRRSGLSAEAFGRALGRSGHRVTVINEMRKYETGKKPILQATADKAREFQKTL